MNISYHWLKEFVEHDYSPEELAAELTDLGLEATVQSKDYDFTGVVAGLVDDVTPLPDSDHLKLCQVSTGAAETVPVVCGAPNVAKGQIVPLATVGAVLHGGLKLKKSKIRGQVSQGMICAEDELGLSDDHTGIIVLDPETPIGLDFKEYLKSQSDTVIEMDLTPNRGDAFSHLGVARDLAASLGKKVRLPRVDLAEGKTPVEELAKVSISGPDGCHRYAARVIQGVKIGPSPKWLADRLTTIGLRPINNVVDASNYVLMELGHPLHTFDYDKLAKGRIDVYFARNGQTFTTLDGEERKLSDQHLLIADGDGPVALAGIMGGLDSEVTEQTRNILIESAYFAPSVIRRGAKTLDLSSEASKRFERDTDIEGLIFALDRVAALIKELAGGEIARGRLDAYPVRHEPKEITLSTAFTNRLLGTDLTAERMAAHLESLGIETAAESGGQITCRVPLFRPELELPVDLIEEIARIEGYNNLPTIESIQVPLGSIIADSHEWFTGIVSRLVGWGYHQHMSTTLTRGEYCSLFSDAQAVELTNPLSSELAYLRTSLIPGLLQAVSFNERRQQQNVLLFEIGAVQYYNKEAYNRADEHFMLGFAASSGSGSRDVHWKDQADRDQFYLKGSIESLLAVLRLPRVTAIPAQVRGLTNAIQFCIADTVVGHMGGIDSEMRDSFSIDTEVSVAELDLDQLGELLKGRTVAYNEVAPFPVVERDIALEVPVGATADALEKTIRDKGGKYFRNSRIFDLYSGEGVASAKKSIAFRLYFQAADRTLKDGEVEQQVKRITAALESKHKAIWRSGS